MTWTVENRKGQRIESVEDWEVLGAPASERHWKDGRSAKELAKAWTSGSGVADLTRLLDTRSETSGLAISSAVAEAQVGFDKFPGGKRNHDLLIRGRTAVGELVIGLEAKADESFGETVADYRTAALTRRGADKPTNAPERLEGLLRDIGSPSLASTPGSDELRYQLFSAVAGTLAAADGDQTAVFVVHEFATSLTRPEKRQANKLALARFILAVTGASPPDDDWWLLGPFHVPASRWARTALYLGHLTTSGSG
jgi:hypothetical protein